VAGGGGTGAEDAGDGGGEGEVGEAGVFCVGPAGRTLQDQRVGLQFFVPQSVIFSLTPTYRIRIIIIMYLASSVTSVMLLGQSCYKFVIKSNELNPSNFLLHDLPLQSRSVRLPAASVRGTGECGHVLDVLQGLPGHR
jgi:hypothetical protein